jgi:4'-phosphopantetheinyl transferase
VEGVPRTLGSSDVHVWVVRLDAWDAEALGSLLGADERTRAARFRREADRRRFVVAHAALRCVLAGYLGRSPRALTIAADRDTGKPQLAGGPVVSFNLSHAEDRALCAVARGRDVGVDVEHVRPDPSVLDIAERFFAPAEVAALRALPPERRTPAFFALWVGKEAYVKARGGGLGIALDSFVLPLDGPEAVVEAPGTAPPVWSIRPVDVDAGYVAAVAASGRDWRVVRREWRPGAYAGVP